MKRVIFNQKGGVGKSSIACNLAAVSAAMGHSTLVIDLDVQGNSSMYLGYDIHDESQLIAGASVAELYKSLFGLRRASSIEELDCVLDTGYENLSLMPASLELSTIEHDLASRFKFYELRKALDRLSGYFDRIYIDTPPALGFYAKSALIAADRVLIPFDCDVFAQRALYNVIENMLKIKNSDNKNLLIEGIVINQFMGQSQLPAELVKEIKSYGIPVLDSYLSSSVKMKISHATQTPLIYLDRTHKLTQQFVRLYELIEGVKATKLRKDSVMEKIDEVTAFVEDLVIEE